MSRGKLYFFIFIAVILGMVTLQLQLHQRMDHRSNKHALETERLTSIESFIKTVSPRKSSVELSDEQKNAEATVSKEFLTQFNQESEHVDLVDSAAKNKTDEFERHLQSWARHLEVDEINYLYAVVQDRSRRHQERLLALDLLGRNQSSKSLVHLKNFVLSDDKKSVDSRSRLDEEMIFKVQAVEEIAASTPLSEAIRFLSEIHQKTEQSFVKDRAQRSLNNLKSLESPSNSPDTEVFEKMIE